MNFPSVIGICALVMFANISSAAREQSHQFRSVKSVSGEVLCAVSPSNKTLSAVRSRIECASTCSTDCISPCHAVNYWKKAKLCQQFFYLSMSYQAQHDCANYQVTFYPAIFVS